MHRDRLITNTIIFTYNFTTKDSSKSVSINEQATTKRKQERTLRGIPKTRDRPPQRMEKSQATNQETIKIRIRTRGGGGQNTTTMTTPTTRYTTAATANTTAATAATTITTTTITTTTAAITAGDAATIEEVVPTPSYARGAYHGR